MRINTNLSALTAFNSLNSTNKSLSKAIASLSTGLRINSAADDAAGFAISEKIRSQTSGLDVAMRNSQDGISMLQTAEGALGETNSMLQRMRELAIQAGNDSLTSQDRQYLQLEIDELKNQIDRIADTTQFNKKRLLDGSCGAVWSSSDPGVKARINGGLVSVDEFGQRINHEGNYRIEVSAEPGQAQVQKSNIMIIKHKNVTMDRTIINRDAGVDDIQVNNVPAGYYEVTSELPTDARAIATGVYGMSFSELDDALTASVSNTTLVSNASILFEVVDVNQEDGNRSITVKTTSHVLKTDGTTESYTGSTVLREWQFNDLSEVLGLGAAGPDSTAADGAFELRLDDSTAFSKGDKFVYNVNIAKGTEDADRVVKFTNEQNPNWPEHWEETEEIWRTTPIQPTVLPQPNARVLFLIDDSGSMSSSINTVNDNISKFITQIKNEGVDDVNVAVASYATHYQLDPVTGDYIYPLTSLGHTLIKHDIGGSEWSANTTDIEAALTKLSDECKGGSVDHYHAISEAISQYGLNSSTDKTYIVLVTDTGAESSGYNGVSSTDVQDLLTTSGTTLVTVRPSWYASVFSGLVTDPKYQVDQSSANWGDYLSTTLASTIGAEVFNTKLFEDTPLHEFDAFSAVFPSAASPSSTLTITQDGQDVDVIVDPTDTMKTLAAKLDAGLGGASSAKFVDNPDSGERGIILRTSLDMNSRLKFSGDKLLINALGLRSNLEGKYSLDASAITKKDIHFKNFYLNSTNGEVYDGDIVLTMNETEMPEFATLGDFEAAYLGQIPKQDVCLRDINNFWDSEGVFLVDHPQKITITQGDGKSSSITLYKTDTLDDVRKKLNKAISDDLGQGAYTDANNFVSYVREGSEVNQGDESVAGTLIVRSAVPGKAGELSFSGDQSILRALGLNTIQESSESTLTASVYDAHSGKVIASDVKAAGTEFKGLIPPAIDIEIDSMAGISADWDDTTKRFIMTRKDTYSVFLHLKNNGTVLQTGANQGEDFMIQMRDASTSALGLSRVNVLTRENASRSVSILDSAINAIASQRAKIGAYSNALERTMNSLTTYTTNLTASDSRLRDADMASTMMDFVKYQILSQSGTSMLAQANQLPQSVLSLLGN
ncbi:MAG: hypothetical protein IJS39_17695 [Synergistaceae bacterium]|nr:hypothetical protein [Synergistaceae bacterium]